MWSNFASSFLCKHDKPNILFPRTVDLHYVLTIPTVSLASTSNFTYYHSLLTSASFLHIAPPLLSQLILAVFISNRLSTAPSHTAQLPPSSLPVSIYLILSLFLTHSVSLSISLCGASSKLQYHVHRMSSASNRVGSLCLGLLTDRGLYANSSVGVLHIVFTEEQINLQMHWYKCT